jgi:RHS repeat-associated protein
VRFPPSHFTGKERDAESGNDDFGARYYNSATGRWLSPDWSASVEPVPYANLTNPQSLNLYGYALNNPLGNVDVDGHDGCTVEGIAECTSALNSEAAVRDESASEQTTDRMFSFAAQQPSAAEAKRNKIGKAAAALKGSTDWAYDSPPCPEWKCNIFVHDVLKMVGLAGNGQPVARQLADPNYHMKDWTDATNGDFVDLHVGDIVAYAYPPGTRSPATGDSGIITAVEGNSVSVTAAGEKSVYTESLSKWRGSRGFMVRSYVGQ